jgi:hypothetical protein
MNKRPLAPKFLNRFDNHLLLNRPDTWSTRFHLVFYYCLLFMIVFAAICFVVPTDHREKSYFGLWSGSAGVLALIGFIVWLVYLFRFNVFKQYGKIFPGDRIKTFAIYFFCIFMLSLSVYIPPVVESIRADMAYSSDELATDINRVNELATKLEHDRIDPDFIADTIKIVPGTYGGFTSAREHYFISDSSEVKWKLESADSVRWMRKDLVIIYNFASLRFVEDRDVERYSGTHVKTNLELYHSAYQHPNADVVTATKELRMLVEKYDTHELLNDFYYNYDYNTYDPNSVHQYIIGNHELYKISSSINHIADRKYRLQDADYGDIAHATYYYCLLLALLIFIFRHSTVKAFFLSLLTAVVLGILSGLFVAVLRLREEGIFFLMLFYFTIFVILSTLILTAKHRSVVYGVALNAFVLMISFIPLICVGLYYSISRFDSSDWDYYSYSYRQYYIDRTLHYHIAEILGGIILVIMIETVFKRLYRKWYALPED